MRRSIVVLLFLMLTGCAGTGVDPFVGMEQAEAQREYYSSQLTATADSRMFGVTETAAAWNFAGTQTAFPYTATALAYTPTPVPTSTPNAAATLVMANAIAESTMVANQAELSNKQVERVRISNTMRAVSAYVIGLVGLFLLVMFGITWAKRLAVIPAVSNEQGKVLPMFDVVEGVAMDVDRLPNGMGSLRHKELIRLPDVTAERQDAVTERAQLVDLRTRAARLPRRLVESQGMRSLPEPTEQVEAGFGGGLLPPPSWELATSWDRDKDNILIGNSEKGLEFWNLRTHPHLAVFGKSQSGKDQRCLRPLVAFLLASGQRVILLGKDIDFLPFVGHPNAAFMPIYDVTKPEEGLKYTLALTAMRDEKNARIEHMSRQGISYWKEERTFMVLDELSNAVIEMGDKYGDETMRMSRSIVNEGAKAGLSLIFSGQRPKGFVDLTTQCGRVVFQVDTNKEKGFALGISNAENLPDIPEGYFYKKFGRLQVTGAFQPSDDEIRAYLSAFQTRALPKPDWIEGVFAKQVDAGEDTRGLPAGEAGGVNEIAEMAESIREQWSPSMSKRGMARLLGFSQYGGAYAEKVDRVLAYLGATTSTAPKQPENGKFEPVVA